jgi:VWFA-related protein
MFGYIIMIRVRNRMHQRRNGDRGVWLSVLGTLVLCFVGAATALAQTGTSKTPPGKAPTAPAASESGTQQSPAAPIRIQSNLVTAPVTVTNRVTGDFVYDLQKSDFQILDNGKPQQITGFTRESNKIAAVILIQNSDSVTPLLGEIKKVGPLFTQLMLGSKGVAAVITFGSVVQVAQGFSDSGETLDATLHGLLPDGNKARLNDALMQGINLLQHRPKGERRVIVVFSSGYDSGSETSKEEIIRRATSTEVEIYGMGLSLTKSYLTRDKQPLNDPTTPENANVTMPAQPGRPSTPSSSMDTFGVSVPITGAIRPALRVPESKIFSNDAEAYAQYTGGIFYAQWSSKALQANLSRIATDIHSQYLLSYVPDDLSETGFHRVEVKVERPGVKLRIRTRKGYYFQAQNP